MAQKVFVQLVDDIDGGEADETVAFGLDGTSYVIDLSAAHASALRDALAPYVANARKAGSGRRGRRPGSSGPSASDVRAWAREAGMSVPERGRVPAKVWQAYADAH